MTTPRDIIETVIHDKLTGSVKTAGDVALAIIMKLESAGFVIAQRLTDDRKHRLIEEMEATVAAQTQDFIRELQRGRSGLKK